MNATQIVSHSYDAAIYCLDCHIRDEKPEDTL